MWVGIVPGAIIGIIAAIKVTMDQMPQMVGLLNAFGGLASAASAIGLFLDANARFGPNGANSPANERIIQSVTLYLSIIVGSITFFGSLIATAKLSGTIANKARVLPGRWLFNFVFFAAMVALSTFADGTLEKEHGNQNAVDWDGAMFGYGSIGGILCITALFILSGVWGIQFVLAIGVGDMPIVISVLNTGSGIGGVFSGFMLASKLLVITGTFVASSGVILSVLMCQGMNRSLVSVLLGGYGNPSGGSGSKQVIEGEKKEIDSHDVAEALAQAKRVIIVPGYGMAAGKAQHAVAKLVSTLRERGVNVKLAVHPVAGRLPGQMNVLLVEARVPYDIVFSMDDINSEFEKADIALMVGASDIVNPSALEDPQSPIAGMPVLKVWEAKKTIVIKRGNAPGYAGVENPLFYKANNYMYYGNALKNIEEVNDKVYHMMPVTREGSGGDSPFSFQKAVVVKEVLHPSPNPKMVIGVLTENADPLERRVALDPDSCAKLTKLNYGILMHRGAGAQAGYLDEQYINSGCIIKDSRDEVIAGSHIINTIMPTTEVLEANSSLRGKFVVCWVGKLTDDGKKLVEKASKAGINLIDVTSIPRITIAQKLDVLSSQAKVVGVRGTIEAASLYPRFFPQEITAAGKYDPAQVMVLGAGVAGLAAIGQACALGAQVRAWDVRDIRDQVESMGAKWITVDFKESGSGEGGYAKESSQAFQAAQKATFYKHAKECDIIITTAAIPGRTSPVLIEDYMVRHMKPGSVIIDLAASGGGNCAVTKKGETYLFEGKVTICGATDFASRMAMQASEMYGTNMLNLYQHVATISGGKDADAGDVIPTIQAVMHGSKDDVVTKQIMCTYEGEIMNPGPPPAPAPEIKRSPSNSSSEEIKKVSTFGDGFIFSSRFAALVVFFACLFLAILVNNENLIELSLIFMLSAWIGFMLVGKVEPALHTPLMSMSNAISGQVLYGGLVMVSSDSTGTMIFGVIACFAAAINIFGGFMVTIQMMKMFSTDQRVAPA